MKPVLIVILSAILSNSLAAQIISSVKTNTDSLVIGDELNIYVEVFNQEAVELTIDYTVYDSVPLYLNMNVPDSISGYADLEFDPELPGKIQGVKLSGGTQGSVYRDTLSCTVWDVGILSIPHPNYMTGDDSVEIQYTQNPLVLAIPPPAVEQTDTTKLIMPIKDIIREEKTWTDYLWVAYTLIAAGVMLLVFYLMGRRKKNAVIPEIKEVRLPSHMVAQDKLDELDKAELWQKGEYNKFQTHLSYIIREYLEKRFRVPALESTTSEITSELLKSGLGHDRINELKYILEIADLIKFAKAEPPVDIHQEFLKKAQRFVHNTKISMTEEEEILLRKEYEEYINKVASLKSGTV